MTAYRHTVCEMNFGPVDCQRVTYLSSWYKTDGDWLWQMLPEDYGPCQKTQYPITDTQIGKCLLISIKYVCLFCHKKIKITSKWYAYIFSHNNMWYYQLVSIYFHVFSSHLMSFYRSLWDKKSVLMEFLQLTLVLSRLIRHLWSMGMIFSR